MTVRQSLVAQLVVAAGLGIYSATVAPTLPNVVPTHWGPSGKPDAYGSPAFALWFGPVVVVVMAALTWALPKLSPKKFEIDRFEASYGAIMFVVALMMGAMHVVILAGTAGKPFDMTRAIMAVLGLFFAVMGNFMGKIRKNFYMGIRTPWTLSSDRVWEATHRRAASLWFWGGLVVAAAALAGLPFWLTFPAFMLLSLWPIADSYRLYRRLE